MKIRSSLNRSLSLFHVIFYGLGTVVGAGIYVLIGKVTAISGIYTPLSFLLAGFIALFTAISYAELSARFPKTAGAALYINKAWNKRNFALLVGIAVILTGIVSAATMIHGFIGYLNIFFIFPKFSGIVICVLILTAIAIWGIEESAFVITVITILELLGLFFVIFIGYGEGVWSNDIINLPKGLEWHAVLLGSFLAFYAFIGFEDMVSIAEEVKQPQKNLPSAIIYTIIISTILYVLVSFTAINLLSTEALRTSSAPIADMVSSKGYSPKLITIISLIAIINGALVQIIMASRMLYGMGQQRLIPRIFSRVNRFTKTPIIATIIVSSLILIFTLWLPIITLAKITSFIMLVIFMLVNISLLKIKRKKVKKITTIRASKIIPLIGAILCFLLILAEIL